MLNILQARKLGHLDVIQTVCTSAWHKTSCNVIELFPLPVFSSLFFKELVKLQHLLPGDDVDLQLRQHLIHEAQVVVDQALPIPPHVVTRAPEDEHSVLAGVEQLVTAT